MGMIIFLVLLGLFFLIAELVFLPGAALGVILALASYAAATYFAFMRIGMVGGFITLGIIILLSLIATIISLRTKTWQRFALKNKVEGQSMQTPADEVQIGDCGITTSRLSPMGKILINGKEYEAKSAEAYIDQRREVTVVGFENFTVIVKSKQA